MAYAWVNRHRGRDVARDYSLMTFGDPLVYAGGVSVFVKGCRTPAMTMWLRRTGLAGVRQASGEETAGSLRSLFRLV